VYKCLHTGDPKESRIEAETSQLGNLPGGVQERWRQLRRKKMQHRIRLRMAATGGEI